MEEDNGGEYKGVHLSGRADILNDVNKDENLSQPLESARGTDRKIYGYFLAIQNFFETQQEIHDLWEKNREMVDYVANEVGYWNEETLNLNIDWNDYNFHSLEGEEADIKDNPKPVHSIHARNLGQTCAKWSAIVNCSGRDDIQGGELIFRDWKDPARRDNYGKAIGDDETCQPQWINELGTLIIFPSIGAHGHQLVVSGGFRRVQLDFKGPSYV